MRHPTVLPWLLLLAGTISCQQPNPTQGPGQDVALREQAFGAENQGRYADAADAFLKLAEREPGRAEWVVAAGRCLGRSGRFRDAIELLDQARGRFPGIPDVPAMLARTYLLKAELDAGALNPRQLWIDAAALAEEVLQQDPNHEDCRLVLAQARYLLGEWDEAVRQAELAVAQHPQRPGAHILLGRIAIDRLRDLLRLHAEGKLEGQALADLVLAIDQQRQLARKSFTKAAELDPTRAHPHVMLARLAALDQHDDEARTHLLDALAIDPDVAIDHSPLDLGLEWKARAEAYGAARTKYEKAPGSKPAKAATLRFYEGRARFAGGDFPAAAALFTQALADNPQSTNAHYYAGLCAFYLGDQDAAERHAAAYAATGAAAFADVVRGLQGETRGQVAAIVQFLADRAYQKGRIEHSRDLNHVLAYLLDSADAWNNRALLCRDTGRYQDALDAYRRALEKEPDSPQLLNDCAVILQHHVPTPERLLEARGMYDRAIAIADKELAKPSLPPELRQRIEKARDDARKNLAELPK
jgi:tetratricopeptide (TPR) repeat protein